MNKYQNGKIYKITSKQTDDVYIGSTTQSLYKRLIAHKTKYKTKGKISSGELMKYDDVIIELIELYPCKTKEELLWRERHHIENNKCVNIYLPIKTKEEILKTKKECDKVYYKENKEQIQKYKSDWVFKNTDRLKIKRSEYNKERSEYNKEYCKKRYENNKDKFSEYAKLKYENNKEQIKERVKAYRDFKRTEFGKLCKMF